MNPNQKKPLVAPAVYRPQAIKSAQEGRKQIGRFYDVYNEDSEKKDLPKNERRYYDDLSSGEEDDWSSDDEMRTDEKKNLKGKRLFAKKHTQ